MDQEGFRELLKSRKVSEEKIDSALKGDYRCRFAVHLPEELSVTG